MTTEAVEEKKTSRKRKTVDEAVERKKNPTRTAKTKAEEAKAAASTSASVASTSKSKTKKSKTEKNEGPSVPKAKVFLENAKELQAVITRLIGNEEDRDPEDKDKEGEEVKTETADASKNGDSTTVENLFTLEAKPQKHSTGSYGWTASVPQGKIKVRIDGNEVELPVTVNLNITVQGSKK